MQDHALNTLSPSVLGLVLGLLSAQQQGQLRLVCKALADTIRKQLKHARTATRLSQGTAQQLQQCFPSLVSLALLDPVSTFHLCHLR